MDKPKPILPVYGGAGVHVSFERDPFPSPHNYLSGIREDNFWDGLIGGSDGKTGGGWTNHVTGLGTFSRDKVMSGSYQEPYRIDDPQLSALFNGNDLAQRIVCDRPMEMFRRGWVLVLPQDDEDFDPQSQLVYPERGLGSESGPAAPGAPLIDPMGGPPSNDSNTDTNPTRPVVAPAAANKPFDPLGEDVMKAGPEGQAPPMRGVASSPIPPTKVTTPITAKSNKKTVKPGTTASQIDRADQAKAVEAYGAKLGLKPRFVEATMFGRLFGGGLLIIGADDGQDMSTPLQEDNIKSIRYLSWIDRRFIFASTWYAEIGPKYGEVETWEMVNPFGGQSNTRVHETRVIRFDGAPVDFLLRRRLLGWTLSVLQAPYDVMRAFDTSFQSVANLMSDMSQAVMKINGLAQLISNDEKTLNTRMAMVDRSRSTARMLYLDAENEEFNREPTPMTGVADTMQMLMLRVSSAAREPVALLFGREPAGLNATGDADFRRFYDTVMGDCKNELEPRLRRIHSLICLAKDGPTGGVLPQHGLEYTWHKLYEPSELEQAQIRFQMAQADDLYIQNKTLFPEEVAISRFRNGDLNLDTDVEMDLRKDGLDGKDATPADEAQDLADKATAAQQTHDASMQTQALAAKPPPGKPAARTDGVDPADIADPTAWDDARWDADGADVHQVMSEDFPDHAISWVKKQEWRGPTRVPVSGVDYSNRAHWYASKASEQEKVHGFAKDLEEGRPVKPVILVQPPKGKAVIVDGHHRALAHRIAGKNKMLVYVAHTSKREGPWDETHAMQRTGRSGASGSDDEKSPADRDDPSVAKSDK